MNILLVTAMFPPIRTGTSFYSRNIANILTKQGHRVVIATVENNETLNEEYPFDVYRVKALHINLKNFFKHLRFSSVFPSNYTSLIKIAKDNNIDAVLLINHYLDIAFPAIYCAVKLKLPLFISVGTQMQSLNPFRNQILRFLDRLVCGRLIFPFAKKIISWDSEIERYIKDVQRKKIADKSVIIPFGANGDVAALSEYNHNYSLVNQIIGVGAIISQRDYIFNLKVFKELLVSFPDLRLKIIGHIYIQSPLEMAKKLGISDKVEFIGEAPHEFVIQELKNSALHWMMLSGNYVGLGTATLEAMTLGIPCVSNVPENLFGKPLLRDMDNIIYADQNVSDVTNKIKLLLTDETLRRKIGTRGRSFVKENLNWEQVGLQISDLLGSYVAKTSVKGKE
jgi:glycosyltransferase involved in cell wall biosynthesis